MAEKVLFGEYKEESPAKRWLVRTGVAAALVYAISIGFNAALHKVKKTDLSMALLGTEYKFNPDGIYRNGGRGKKRTASYESNLFVPLSDPVLVLYEQDGRLKNAAIKSGFEVREKFDPPAGK